MSRWFTCSHYSSARPPLSLSLLIYLHLSFLPRQILSLSLSLLNLTPSLFFPSLTPSLFFLLPLSPPLPPLSLSPSFPLYHSTTLFPPPPSFTPLFFFSDSLSLSLSLYSPLFLLIHLSLSLSLEFIHSFDSLKSATRQTFESNCGHSHVILPLLERQPRRSQILRGIFFLPNRTKICQSLRFFACLNRFITNIPTFTFMYVKIWSKLIMFHSFAWV